MAATITCLTLLWDSPELPHNAVSGVEIPGRAQGPHGPA